MAAAAAFTSATGGPPRASWRRAAAAASSSGSGRYSPTWLRVIAANSASCRRSSPTAAMSSRVPLRSKTTQPIAVTLARLADEGALDRRQPPPPDHPGRARRLGARRGGLCGARLPGRRRLGRPPGPGGRARRRGLGRRGRPGRADRRRHAPPGRPRCGGRLPRHARGAAAGGEGLPLRPPPRPRGPRAGDGAVPADPRVPRPPVRGGGDGVASGGGLDRRPHPPHARPRDRRPRRRRPGARRRPRGRGAARDPRRRPRPGAGPGRRHDAHAGPRLRAGGRVPGDRGAAGPRRDRVGGLLRGPRCPAVQRGHGERPGAVRPRRRRAQLLRQLELRHLREGRPRGGERALRAPDRRDDRRRGHPARASRRDARRPARVRPHRRAARRRAVRGRRGAAAAAGGRGAAQRRRQGRGRPGARGRRRRRAHPPGLGPALVRDRPEGGRRPGADRLRRLGALQPRRRGRRRARPDGGRLPAARRLQHLRPPGADRHDGSALMARVRPRRRDLWAGWRPNGVGETKPNHYREILRTIWANRRRLPYAARIVRKGVCDGCALGVAGLHDWTIDGVHLCTTRLSLLSINTMDAADPALLADVAAPRRRPARDLREPRRLGHPMVRRHGEPGFTRVTWDAALDLVAGAVRPADPGRVAFFLTSRGVTNEVYYVAQKVARFLGTNNVDNAARVCHAPSTGALKQAVGAAATTISYGDLMQSDLVVLWGANVANAQPVMMKYLYLARRRGTRIAVVNPHREPGLERYWIPSSPESALLGTRMADAFFQVNTGGDEAFALGVLKLLMDEGGLDERFVAEHTDGFDAVREECARHGVADLGAMSGVGEAGLREFADMYRASESAIFVWSMGITQHAFGSDNVRALLNVALARGNVGRPGAGLMPIRGHSGVQGGAEMGAYATAFPGGVPISPESARELEERYGFPVPGDRGLTAEEMLEAAGRGELDVLYASGGNFLDVLPDTRLVAERLSRVPVRVHQDIVVSSQMLVDPPPGGTVVLLPAATRYEQPGG